MNSESPSYSYLKTILDPYIQPLTKAFDQEWRKYYQQIGDLDRASFEQLPIQEKGNWGYIFRREFDIEVIENIYKADFLRRVVPEIVDICKRYDKRHSQKNYVASNLFYEVKVQFSEQINKDMRWAGAFLPHLSKLDAEKEKNYRQWLVTLNKYLYSEAQRIIEEVKRETDSKKNE